jgi:hypothetical protein
LKKEYPVSRIHNEIFQVPPFIVTVYTYTTKLLYIVAKQLIKGQVALMFTRKKFRSNMAVLTYIHTTKL